MKAVIVQGNEEPCGVYLLRISNTQDLDLRFGRFQGGASIPVAHGDLLYVGSAMARSGSMTLARRLLRHATRRTPLGPHPIRRKVLNVFAASGLASAEMQPPSQKKLFWNIDYLLDQESVQIMQIFVLRSTKRLEDDAANIVALDSASHVVAPGLGAHDRPGHTHLFYIRADERWWEDLPARLAVLL